MPTSSPLRTQRLGFYILFSRTFKWQFFPSHSSLYQQPQIRDHPLMTEAASGRLVQVSAHRCCPAAAWGPSAGSASTWCVPAAFRTVLRGWTGPGVSPWRRWLQSSRRSSGRPGSLKTPRRWSPPHLRGDGEGPGSRLMVYIPISR